MNHPIDVFFGALTSVWGRALCFGAAIFAASFVASGFMPNSMAFVPVFVMWSIAAGWGLVFYPLLLVGFALYVGRDSSPFWLLLVFAVCAADFRYVMYSMQNSF